MTGNRKPVVVLQDRDRLLLDELSLMRVIDREQAKIVAGFGSTTRANERLLNLTRIGLLKRVFTGGRRTAYLLNSPTPELTGKQSSASGAILFAQHQLAINDIYIKVKFKSLPQARLLRWLRFSEALSKAIPLIPDAFLELEAAASIRAMFLEVDLGTEAMPIWHKKIQLYLSLAVSGDFTRIFSQSQFRVLVILNSEHRLENLRRLVAKSTDKIFWFSTIESINRDGLWSHVWFRPRGDQRQSLL